MDLMLNKIFITIIAIDFFALGVLLIFLINARMNLKREIAEKKVYFKALTVVQTARSSEEAAKEMKISPNEFILYCEEKNIEIPEKRKERLDKIKKTQEEDQQRIMEEEAAWRAEQEQIAEERRKAKEEEARKRQERFRKFRFK
ncbi:MAG TPA: hypothetical protein VMZ04_02295 [Anaerolineae bacterium]|nr:hypothetical protein [Anaerolineae bacterium]